MIQWLLDDGPFGLLAGVFDSAWVWPEGVLSLVREVADGAHDDRSGRRGRLLTMKSPTGGSSFAVHDGGAAAAAMVWGHLRPREAEAKRDLGEDVSIAVCATELPEAVFVTMDKRAAYVALAELGRTRVAAPFELWDWLERNGHISLAAFQTLCEKTAKLDHCLTAIPRCHQR